MLSRVIKETTVFKDLEDHVESLHSVKMEVQEQEDHVESLVRRETREVQDPEDLQVHHKY
jgi:hypothetical protein